MGLVKRENDKVFIENLRKISWDTGEMCEYASAMVSAFQSTGDQLPYPFVLGVSGVAFRFTIDPGEWDFGNYSIRNLSADIYEPVRRSFGAAGYAYAVYEKGEKDGDKARITASIDRGVPVIAFGVVGPSDCVVISGYDEGGEVLMGWSTYQDIPDDHNVPHDATGYFRKPGWHENTHAYILIGDKTGRPPLEKTYLKAFEWAVRLARTPSLGRKATGLEGLRVWAGEMLQDAFFPTDDPDLMGWRYTGVAINMTMLRDHCLAAPFLRQALADVPGFAPDLPLAIECYDEVIGLQKELNEIISDNFSQEAMKAIYSPDIRQRYADTILRIRDSEAQGISHLERLLARYV